MIITANDKPETRILSALPIPDDPLDDVLGSLGGISCFGLNGCGLLDAYGELDLEGIDADGNFVGAPDETAAPDTTTTIPDNVAVAEAGEMPKRTERILAARGLSPASSPSRSDDERRDPSFRPIASTRRPKQQKKPQQRAPAAGQFKRKSSLTAAPSLVVVEEKDARRCRQCGTTKTGQWRAGPAGTNTLCNACGLQWKNSAAPNAKRRKPAAAAKPRHGKNENGCRLVVKKRRSD
jgi:hypothetical protein